MPPTRSLSVQLWRRHGGLLIALAVALLLRALLWGRIPRTGLISDEGEYLSAADWLAHGRGFAWYLGYLWTRAPVYPLFVAVHLRLFGSVVAVYITQTLLSLLDVVLVYWLACRMVLPDQASRARAVVPTLAALLMAIYLPFALYTQVLLSETLFVTLLLGAFVALAKWAEERRRTKDKGRNTKEEGEAVVQAFQRVNVPTFPRSVAVAGLLFGLATLTRSLTLFFIPVVALWLLVRRPTPNDQEAPGGKKAFVLRPWEFFAFVLAAALVILPWTAYNSLRLYGGLVVVDTSGAFNILLGGRTAYDGDRNDAATRDFALALLDPGLTQPQRAQKLADQLNPDTTLRRAGSCLYSQRDPQLLAAIARPAIELAQAERQQLMTREGFCLIRAKPLAFVQKSLSELIDLFQINYGGDERFADGFALGRLPRWYALALFLLDDTLYVLALPLAVIGWALARKRELSIENEERSSTAVVPCSILNAQFSTLVGLWWLYNLAVAPLLFAINRFRLPLLPFAFIFAAYALAQLPAGWRALRSRYGALCALLAGLLFLIAATPYAYFEPRAPGADSRWASYLGPYPSSIVDTWRAWRARPGYLREQAVQAALARADANATEQLLGQSDVTSHTLALARPLLAALRGQPDAGLALLDRNAAALSSLEIALLRADLLRSKGERSAARAIFTQELVDKNNPVQWAWDWLHPAPLPDNRLDIAGNLDLGYLRGCYLGEGDPQAGGNFRWCTDGAQIRFPHAGSGAPQTLVLRADGRGWAGYAVAPPPVQVLVGGALAGTFTPDLQSLPREFAITLPATPKDADVVVTLRSGTFIPSADRYLRQQGRAVVGQVQRLGVRLDWAELRPAAGIEN